MYLMSMQSRACASGAAPARDRVSFRRLLSRPVFYSITANRAVSLPEYVESRKHIRVSPQRAIVFINIKTRSYIIYI